MTFSARAARTFSRAPWIAAAACAVALAFGATARATPAEFDAELLAIAHGWDQANYEIKDEDAKRKTFEALSQRAESFAHTYPDRAEPLVWEGIVLSTYAGVKGGLGALGLAKKSRDCLLAALKVDPNALHGSAYTSLGVLYYKVPGFPLGFGDKSKADDYLHKALALNPNGIDPNYFYGELLFERGDYAQSMRYLEKALAAPARAERPIADSGRRAEVSALMARVKAKMG